MLYAIILIVFVISVFAALFYGSVIDAIPTEAEEEKIKKAWNGEK